MGCNSETGQCYYLNGACDPNGDAVCSPGSECIPSPLPDLVPGACSCSKEIPGDLLSPDFIPCHEGISCKPLGDIEQCWFFDL